MLFQFCFFSIIKKAENLALNIIFVKIFCVLIFSEKSHVLKNEMGENTYLYF